MDPRSNCSKMDRELAKMINFGQIFVGALMLPKTRGRYTFTEYTELSELTGKSRVVTIDDIRSCTGSSKSKVNKCICTATYNMLPSFRI